MKKIAILLFTIFLIGGCRTKTETSQENFKKEEMYTKAQLIDSLKKVEKLKESFYQSKLDEIQRMNKSESSENSSNVQTETDVRHKGGTTKVETPTGTLIISGSGEVDVRSVSNSSTFTKKQIEEYNEIKTEKAELTIENENLKIELKSQTNTIVDLQTSLDYESKKEVKSKPCRIWIWILIGFFGGLAFYHFIILKLNIIGRGLNIWRKFF